MNLDDVVVHIVEDKATRRKALASLLSLAGFTVRVHVSGTAFLSIAPGLRHACLVTDLRMREMTGLELLRRAHEMPAAIAAVVVAGHRDVAMGIQAMKIGAIDFVERPFEDATMVEAVGRAARAAAEADDSEDISGIRSRLAQLTSREREILAGVVEDLPNKAIASDLKISPRTVEAHRASVMAKMLARNLAELVRMATLVGGSEGGRQPSEGGLRRRP